MPAWHASRRVQAFPSSQVVPSGFVGVEQAPLAGSHTPASGRWPAALQTTGWPPGQVPAWHGSVCVHAFPSSHGVPSRFMELEHAPVAGSHTPAAWHWSAALQTTDVLPVQVPAWHVSVCMHAFPSSHGVRTRVVEVEHAPVAGSHTPAAWHWSAALQPTGVLPVQVPAWHVSVCVHAFPSSHGVPSRFMELEHAPVAGSHTPAAWHWSAALQTTGVLPVQVPAWQVSVCMHAFPSSH